MIGSGVVRDVMTKGVLALRVTPRTMGESLLLRVEGRLTVATAPTFHSAIASALHSNARTLVIDLREVTDIDARGIGALVKAHLLGQQHNRSIRFLIRNGHVAHLIRLANLNEALTLLEEAGESVPQGESGMPHHLQGSHADGPPYAHGDQS